MCSGYSYLGVRVYGSGFIDLRFKAERALPIALGLMIAGFRCGVQIGGS